MRARRVGRAPASSSCLLSEAVDLSLLPIYPLIHVCKHARTHIHTHSHARVSTHTHTHTHMHRRGAKCVVLDGTRRLVSWPWEKRYTGAFVTGHICMCVCVFMCACVRAPASVLSCIGAYVVLIDGVCIHTYSKVLCTHEYPCVCVRVRLRVGRTRTQMHTRTHPHNQVDQR